jgi:hypothetical protein
MPIGINGSGSITGISAGGLPDGSVTPTDLSQPLTLGTAQASTSGTAIDFTGIPSWVKRVTVMFNGVSTSSTSNYLVQIGAGSVQSSSYFSASAQIQGGGNGVSSSSAGFVVRSANASSTNSGHMTLTLVSGFIWAASHCIAEQTTSLLVGGGNVTLSGTLDRIRITTVNGTDTFDAGSINILYE